MSETNKVENGKRLIFDHQSSAGWGAIVEHEGRIMFAYAAAEGGASPPPVGEILELDGERYRALTVKKLTTPIAMFELGLGRVDQST